MSKFTYIAKTKDGVNQQGTITASNEDIALSTLQNKDLIVISLKDLNQSKLGFGADLEIFNRVSARELVVFTRILSIFLEVQIPLVDAVSVLRDQNKKNKYFAEVLDQLVLDLQDGSLLSDAMARHPKVFDRLYVSIMRSGEVSGGLQESLLYMADYLEEQYELNSKIKGAMAYPTFVLVIFVVLGLGIAYFILPQLVEVLSSVTEGGASLPWTTQIIISGSNFLQDYIWVVLIGLLGTVGSIIYLLNTNAGKKWADKWKLRLPIFGDLFTKVYIVRLSTNLKNLLGAGVPLISSLEISSKVVGNYVFEKIIQESILNVKAGGQFSDTLIKYPEFPYIASQIIAVGESTGKTVTVLETITRFYKQELDTMIDNLTVLIEPFMIVILGIGVAIFVISILMPIYNITGSL